MSNAVFGELPSLPKKAIHKTQYLTLILETCEIDYSWWPGLASKTIRRADRIASTQYLQLILRHVRRILVSRDNASKTVRCAEPFGVKSIK